MAGIILRVTELLEFFNPSERKVAAYILDQQQKVVGMTVGELAEQSQTNKATIIRFCKKVGCSGYRDFPFNWQRNWQSHRIILRRKSTRMSGSGMILAAL